MYSRMGCHQKRGAIGIMWALCSVHFCTFALPCQCSVCILWGVHCAPVQFANVYIDVQEQFTMVCTVE